MHPVIAQLNAEIAADREALRRRERLSDLLRDSLDALARDQFPARLEIGRGGVLVLTVDRTSVVILDAAKGGAPVALRARGAAVRRAPTPGKRGYWTKERDAALRALRDKGLTFDQIGAELGMSEKSARSRYWRIRHGLGLTYVPRCDWPESMVQDLRRLLAEGKSCVEVAEALGLTARAVTAKVRNLRKAGEVIEVKKAAASLAALQKRWVARRVVTDEVRAKILQMRRDGQTNGTIAAETGVHKGYVSHILRAARAAGEDVPASKNDPSQKRVKTPKPKAEQKSEQKSRQKVKTVSLVRKAPKPPSADVDPVPMPVASQVSKAFANGGTVRGAGSEARLVGEVPSSFPAFDAGDSAAVLRSAAPEAAKLAPVAGALRAALIEAEGPVYVLPGMSDAQKRAVIEAHMVRVDRIGGWDAARDLALCEAVFGGQGLEIAADAVGVEVSAAKQRFAALTAPFRDVGRLKGLPIEAGAFVLAALRVRAAGAKEAAA